MRNDKRHQQVLQRHHVTILSCQATSEGSKTKENQQSITQSCFECEKMAIRLEFLIWYLNLLGSDMTVFATGG